MDIYGGLVLGFAALAALLVANSPLAEHYGALPGYLSANS
jgi:Na+/H+ antiporter NhaA